MPLTDGYGVVIGTVAHHYIEPPDTEGRWPHYHIYVNTPAGEYQCVINLKSRNETKIQYRDFRNQSPSYFPNILSLADGYHPLSRTAGSGALDVVRNNGLKDPFCYKKWYCWCYWFFKKRRCPCTRWWLESGVDLIQLMEYYLTSVQRIYIFGEPYNTGLGIHNIHMNQGDPIDSPFSAENGIWQDGGLILQYADPEPRLSVFVTKFQTQSLATNDNGQPL